MGKRPILLSGVPNCASSAATARSQAHISPSPPASACPLTRATMGSVQASIVRNSSAMKWRGSAGSVRKGVPSAVGLRSPPAQKARSPAPVSTTARTSPSAMAARRAPAMPVVTASLMALRRSGRLMVIHCTDPRRSHSTTSVISPPGTLRPRW
ncbi:MAG TPA: hypothetical protein VD995_31105 [Azospirillum sp.]|nr:hypothetical protein [Azospirillum sp.]